MKCSPKADGNSHNKSQKSLPYYHNAGDFSYLCRQIIKDTTNYGEETVEDHP